MIALLAASPFIPLKFAPSRVTATVWTFFIVWGVLGAYGVFHRLNGTEIMLSFATTQALLAIVLVPVFVASIPKRLFRHWRKAVIALAAIEAVWFLIDSHGMFRAESFSSAFIAFAGTLVPITLLVFIPLLYFIKGSTAYLVLTAWAIARYRLKAVLVLIPIFVLGFLSEGSQHLFKSSDRVDRWVEYMQWWWGTSSVKWTGIGFGSFEWFSRIHECGGNVMTCADITVWRGMHNDYLQIIFEGGIPAFAVAVFFLIYLSGFSRTLPVLAAFCAMSLTYHPIYMPLTAAVFCCIIIEAEIRNS